MKIQRKFLPETHYNERLDKVTGKPIDIDMLVLHCSAYPSEKLTQVFMDLGVSAHYIIDEDGSVIQLVDETKRAWHAGAGTWNGIGDINSHSVGIEVINPSLGHSAPYQEKQIDALIELSGDIIKRYNILPHNVFAHSDMAPARKYDPGRLFPWKKLSKAGIGLYPAENTIKNKCEDVKILLEKIGYPVQNEPASLRAFLRHFMPERIPDRENPEMDSYSFLLEYDQNLPAVLEKQALPDTQIITRLNQVADAFEKSRHKVSLKSLQQSKLNSR